MPFPQANYSFLMLDKENFTKNCTEAGVMRVKSVTVYSSKTGTCGHQSPFTKNFCFLFLKQKKINWK